MQGQLSDHPLAELIHEISTDKLSGVVRVERERAKAAVYADAGRIVLASSNLRSSRLIECLRRWNALDPAGWHQTESLLSMPAANTDAGLVDLLVNQGILSAERASELQARQSEDALRPLLQWRDGEWAFDARVRLSEESRVTIDDRRLLMEAARLTHVEFVARSFTDEAEIIRPASGIESNVEVLPAEAFLLSRVDAPIAVGELLQISALPTAQAQIALYSLVLGSLLTRDRLPRAFTPEAMARGRDAQAAPANTASSRITAEEKARPLIKETDEEKLKALFGRGEAGNHYAVLGVSHNAPPDRIKAAYYALAKRFHPDIFSREQTSPELRARIEKAFAIIANSYETLKTPESRAKYDLQLLSRNPPAPAAVPPAPEVKEESHRSAASPSQQTGSPAFRAEASFQEALRAEKANNPVLALARFAEAARLAPQEARYRACYGRALASERSTRRQGEAELLAAVGLSSTDATFRIMLAEFYRDAGLRRRAIGEIERALQMQPGNARAQQLHKELQRGA